MYLGSGLRNSRRLSPTLNVSAPLPAPTLQQSWAQTKLQLSAYVQQPKLAENVAELNEWYWEGACEELSDQASATLRANAIAMANFESLCMFDMDAGSDQSAAEHLLSIGQITPVEVDLLRKLVHARLRVVRIEPAGDLGLHKAHDINSGKVFWLPSDPSIAGLEVPTEFLLRLLVFPGMALIAGPCFGLPSERSDALRREAEELVNHMMHAELTESRSVRERGLVDFSHQWAERCLADLSPPVPWSAPFTLLRGA